MMMDIRRIFRRDELSASVCVKRRANLVMDGCRGPPGTDDSSGTHLYTDEQRDA